MSVEADSVRTLDELKTLYDLEEGIRDLIVEGRNDRRFYRWYLREKAIRNVEVYAVDDRVIIGSEAVLATGGEVGARGRVLGLAAVADGWVLAQENLTCVIDSDRDCLESPDDYDHLLRTDVGSLDAYALQPRPLRQFAEVVVGRDVDAEQIIADLIPPLMDLFLVRAALHREQEVALVDNFSACCDFRVSGISVDVEELVRRSLAREGLGGEQGRVLATLETLKAKLPEEPLRAVRGHDVAPLLIRRLNLRNEWARPATVEASLRGTLTVDDLDNHHMFKRLRERLT